MRRYIEHIKNTRTTHERRVHALQISGVITAALFAVWLGTLSLRLGGSATVAQDGSQTINAEQTSLTASAAQAQQTSRARLEVSTTSVEN